LNHPDFIEFEIGSYCNRKCDWCPNVLNSRGSEKNHVAPQLWQDFLHELNDHQYAGWLALHNYNEPLLDPNIYTRIQEVKSIAPRTKLSVFSNGDPLNKDTLDKLISLSVNEIRVTLYPKVKSNKDLITYDLKRLLARINLDKRDFKYKATHRGEEYRIQLNLAVSLFIIVPNISNYVNRGKVDAKDVKHVRVDPCHLPSHSVAIDYLGNYKLCCQVQDVLKDPDYKIGNIGEEGFFKLWHSQKMKDIQTTLKNSDFEFLDKCAACNHSKNY